MKCLGILTLTLAVTQATPVKRLSTQGIDISNYQHIGDWNALAINGVQFAYIKATEGIAYMSPDFSSQRSGAANANIIHGAYHFAHPDRSSGTAQAEFFLAHGGAWIPGGMTLPGVLDIEPNPNGHLCYGLSASEMVSWIRDFSETYRGATKRYPVIYTITSWWKSCTDNSADFGGTNPLWLAHWALEIGPLPAGWTYPTIWQYANGSDPGDKDVFRGDTAALKEFASGG